MPGAGEDGGCRRSSYQQFMNNTGAVLSAGQVTGAPYNLSLKRVTIVTLDVTSI